MRSLFATVVALVSFAAGAQPLTQNFDDISTLPAAGWVFTNNSVAVGASGWFQGNGPVFAAQTGAAGSYIAGNFVNAGVGGNISNWMLSPPLASLQNGQTLKFWTRSAGALADRLEVRLCVGSPCTDVGATDATVGTFTTLLLAINPGQSAATYPATWTQFSIVLSGLPAGPNAGRFGFRYFVTDTSAHGDYIGIDTLSLTAVSVPAPVFQGTVSRKVHGVAGTFDLPLVNVPTNPTTEPRTGPSHTLVFTFDKPITGASASVSEGAATLAAPTFSGNTVTVALSNVTNKQYVTVALSNVTSSDGGTGGIGSVRVGFLLGDVNQSRVVSVADLGLVNAQLAQSVTAANYLKDVNANGTLTVADKGITNANLTNALPPP
jgi:hypothetical protein